MTYDVGNLRERMQKFMSNLISNSTEFKVKRHNRIVVRTVLFSWLVSLVTLFIFGLYLVPKQKEIYLSNLNSQAVVIAGAIRDLSASALVTEDYGVAVDQCVELLNKNESIRYIVLQRKDGFSLVHTLSGWEMSNEALSFKGQDAKEDFVSQVVDNPLGEEQVYNFTGDLNYLSFPWGSIHIGLSLDQYYDGVHTVFVQTALAGGICALVGLLVTILHAKRLVNPIILLEKRVKEVSEGNLDVVAEIHSGDEVEALALSFNQMTEQVRSAQRELVEAKDVAEAASEAKSTFLANMSHEIRTPLNGVVGMLQILRKSPLNSRQVQFVNKALYSADALLVVINDILDFSKIEAGKLEIESIEFNPCVIVENVVSMFAETAEKKGLELICSIHYNVPDSMIGDPNRVTQILVNLIGNAVKFTEKGEIVVTLSVDHKYEDHQSVICFKIKDSGVGIAPAEQDRIFEAFRQEDNSTTRRFGGTGLGLGISRRLADLMGSRIMVDSTVGKGSTFMFNLNVKTSAVYRTGGWSIRGMRVLVVDDHSVSRVVMAERMRSWGADVLIASTGGNALRMMRDQHSSGNRINLVLIDWDMPGMSGEELGHAISNDPALNSSVLVMLCSASDFNSARSVAAGFDAFVPKPARQSELYDAIINAINGDGAYKGRVEESAGGMNVSRFGLKILIAEDNEINQVVAGEIIRSFGCECDIVDDGQQALDAVGRNEYDIVFMDCMMPVMDGYEAVGKIRERENNTGRRLPIIALTANAMKGDREQCLEAGMDDYLPKPLEPEVIERMLMQWGNRGSFEEKTVTISDCGVEEMKNLFDRNVMLSRCMNKAPLMDKLLVTFFTQTDTDFLKLKTALEVKDAKQARHAAHRIKGAAAYLTMSTIQEQSGMQEEFAKESDFKSALAGLEKLEQEIEAVRSYLKSEGDL